MKSSALILSSKTCRAVFLACGSSAFLWLALPANAGIALFDFDTGTPTLSTYQNLPLDQTSDGVTAHLTGNFSIQSDATIFKSLSQFSANYVYPNAAGGVLQIQFSAPLTRLNFNFATTDTHQIEYTTLLQLTAYENSTGSPSVGSTTARGSFGTDSFPTGTLTFDSGGQPFNLVEIRTAPNQPNGVSFFLVDNIAAEVVPVPEPTQAGLFAALACGLAVLGRTVISRRSEANLNPTRS